MVKPISTHGLWSLNLYEFKRKSFFSVFHAPVPLLRAMMDAYCVQMYALFTSDKTPYGCPKNQLSGFLSLAFNDVHSLPCAR